MAKASMSSTKYVITGIFNAQGYIDKSDLIGSFFGQTEGLIGDDLELSNLQKTGKLGRIEIKLKKYNGETKGEFEIPTALNKVEVSLLAAALESITKISHTSGLIEITQIKDAREDKRTVILKRAEEILSKLREDLPESHNIVEDIEDNIKKKTLKKYFGEEIFGGPDIERQKEIILVEGRADVSNLIKHGISNVISFNGSSIPKSIVKITKGRIVVAFLDSDKGGADLLEELKSVLDLDYYVFAPSGKEVEDLNLKEITKCLKNKIELEKIPKTQKVITKIKDIFQKDLNKVNDKIDKFQKDVLYKNKDEKESLKSQNEDVKRDFQSPGLYLKRNELEKITTKINDLIKNDYKDFIVLNGSLRTIKSGKISEFYETQSLTNPRYLILNAICESSIIKKSNLLGIKIIISEKYYGKKDLKHPIVRLFSDVLK